MTNDQPKPATGINEGEWMASTVEMMFMANPKMAHYAIADAHNAALSEKQSAVDGALRVIRTSQTLLAAEREKVKELEEQVRNILIAYDALKKVRR